MKMRKIMIVAGGGVVRRKRQGLVKNGRLLLLLLLLLLPWRSDTRKRSALILDGWGKEGIWMGDG